MRFLKSRSFFLDHSGGRKGAKIDHKLSCDHVRHAKSENGDFCYPSLAKSLFLVASGSEDTSKMAYKIDFCSEFRMGVE